MKRLLTFFILCICVSNVAHAVSAENATLVGGGATDVSVPSETTDFIPADVLLYTEPADTECATAVFANALAANSNKISETADEIQVQEWINTVFTDGNVLREVLACPEFAELADDDAIKLLPIKYTFPGGREIVINYETQPKILKQRITLSEKRDLPSDPNPRISPDDGSVWTNTDPAWYGILVVESGTLDEFVGPNKNNTISLQWIEDNIDTIFPRGGRCTSKSAIAGNREMINMAMKETVSLEDDTNDYYVAGDVSLRWISYLEIALDVVITIVTWGAGTAVVGASRAARASRALKNLGTSLRALSKLDSVRDYIRLGQRATKAAEELKKLDKIMALDDLAKLDRVADARAVTISNKADDILTLTRAQAKRLDDLALEEQRLLARQAQNPGAREAAKIRSNLTRVRQERQTLLNQLGNPSEEALNAAARAKKLEEIQNYEKTMRELESTDPNVRKYLEQSKTFSELNQYRRALRSLRTVKQRGNLVARAWRSVRAAYSGGQKLRKAEKIARSSTLSGRIRDWLFQSTMRNATAMGRLERSGGLIYGALTFIGGMYDWTETSTGDFTSGIEFKPLGLLSADDLQGQENVVNHGMWLMWAGDAYSAADDDAAFLQAMDFANKFHFNLDTMQNDKNRHVCNVDIFVVRPIIRNPGTDNAELYYLVMNDEPWTTRDTDNE